MATIVAVTPAANDLTGAYDVEDPTSSFWTVVFPLMVVVIFHDQCVPLSNLSILTEGEGAF